WRAVQPCLELPQRAIELPGARVGDAEIHVDRGGWRQERNRPLEADPRTSPIATFTQRDAEKRITLACRRIQLHTLSKFSGGAIFRTAVPVRHAEMVVRIR